MKKTTTMTVARISNEDKTRLIRAFERGKDYVGLAIQLSVNIRNRHMYCRHADFLCRLEAFWYKTC